ncbi:NUDIX domain-containing protein [Phenylobacterium sp. LjRoot219]|uniref:NUDIX hydrolase n=1 Tax=Phenylobacterium sp. LjRoot219 TaxID=3342283 RepID=UPI003ED0E32A
MSAINEIQKVGLAMVEAGKLLVVRKRGTKLFILPGGKPEGTEADLDALHRELMEELHSRLGPTTYEGAFEDVAAERANTRVVVRLYVGQLLDRPEPASEIEEFAWVPLSKPGALPLAPSIVNKILPYLCARESASGHRRARSQRGRSDRL